MGPPGAHKDNKKFPSPQNASYVCTRRREIMRTFLVKNVWLGTNGKNIDSGGFVQTTNWSFLVSNFVRVLSSLSLFMVSSFILGDERAQVFGSLCAHDY